MNRPTLQIAVLGILLDLLTTNIVRAEEDPREARADQRYREADRLAARGRNDEAATAYFEAGKLFLAISGARVALPLERLHRRALSALRRAAERVPAARSELAALCAQLTTDTGGRVALPSACDPLRAAPAPVVPAPAFITSEPIAEPVAAAPASDTSAPPVFPVTLSIRPRRAARASIDVQWDDDPGPVRHVGAVGVWQLPGGAHIVEVHAPGFVTATAAVRVGPGGTSQDIRLRRAPDIRARIGLSAAFAGLGAVLLGTGAALVADGRAALARTNVMFPDITKGVTNSVYAHIAGVHSQQFTVLGAGAGFLVAIPTAAVGATKLSAGGVVLGAVTLGMGTGLLISARRRSAEALDAPHPYTAEFFAEQRRPQLAAAALLGGGAALLAGSLTALVTQAALRKRRAQLDVRPQIGANQWALQLAGAF